MVYNILIYGFIFKSKEMFCFCGLVRFCFSMFSDFCESLMILCVFNMQFEIIVVGVIVGLGGQVLQNNILILNNINFVIFFINLLVDVDFDDIKVIKCK